MSWSIANKQERWHPVPTETPLVYFNAATGEIREHGGGFDGLVRERDEDREMLGRIAQALGRTALRRWEDGDCDLVAEVRAVVALALDHLRSTAEALNSGDGTYRP